METKSYNSNRFGENWNKILTYLKEADGPQTPKTIASATQLNHNSVRVRLREMKKRGLVHQPGYGRYETAKNALTLEGYGVGELRCLPRVHNLMVRGRCRAVVSGVFSFGFAKVRIKGSRNGYCTVYLSCGEGVDFVGSSVLMVWLGEKVGWIGEPEICRYELNEDYAGVKLDGRLLSPKHVPKLLHFP